MKILWVSQNLPYPPKTGVLQRNYNLISQASQFAELHLVAILKEDILPGFDEVAATRALQQVCASLKVVRLPIERSRARFLAVLAKSLLTEAPFTANWATSDVLRRALQEAAARMVYDLVYFDTISLAQYRPLFASSVTVLNHHNIESQLMERRTSYERNALKQWYLRLEARKLRRYEAAVARSFDANLVVSSLDGERLAEICPGVTTRVVANGVDVDYFRAHGHTAERGHLVMVSGMNWFPNRDAVLFMTREIWPALTDALRDLKLTIVGASPPRCVRELSQRDRRVSVTGFVDDVRPYMEAAQVYLCPMRDGGGTRLKILDALSMGKAIVATRMALEGIDVQPERDVLIANTPAEFVAQITRIVENDDLRRSLGARGRAFVERHFSWRVIGDSMRRDFTGVVNARRQHV